VGRDGLSLDAPLGRISISAGVIAQIVGHTAVECYGVVAMARGPVGRILRRDGIEISGEEDGVRIDVHVVVEYGLNLAEVASTLRNRVAYEVERLTGLTIRAVEVHIDDVRRSE